MTAKPDIYRLLELQKLMLEFRSVQRASYIAGTDQRENDAEHSYFLAMASWFLSPHFPKLKTEKMFRLALAHDLIEVHSGDTFAFGKQEHIDSKVDREQAALIQLRKDWADFPEMLDAIDDYAKKSSDEAKFVYALDKLLPPMVNFLGDGRVWRENNVTIEMFKAEKERKIPQDSPLYPYYQQILAFFLTKPELFANPSQQR